MAVLSKWMEVSIPYKCYEVIHTWEPDCNLVAVEAGGIAFYQALKLYAPLYLVTYLLKRQFTLQATIHSVRNLLISSSFLGYYGFYLNLFSCLTRKLMGRYYNVFSSYFPAFAASFLCYFVERENRRRALAVYLANAATETALRMGVSRGIIKPYPNAEVYLFSVTMAAFFYFIKKWGFSDDAVGGIIKFLFGKDEAKRKIEHESRKKSRHVANQDLLQKTSNGITSADDFRVTLATFFHKICSSKHNSCNHTSTCIMYCLEGFFRPFLMGYFALSVIRCLSMRKELILSPSLFLSLLTDKRNFNLGLFLGGFGGTFKIFNCLLRWCIGKDLPIYAVPAALLGGLCMKFFPSSTISLYCFWKLLELGYLSGIEAGILPHVKGFKPLLFSASTALLLHASALEPHNLKPSYWRFLQQITNNRISEFNRRTLDIFGTHASKMRPDFWPKLDHRCTSQRFKEIAVLWLTP
ncbi:unnamed protein product [Larinioides sclopetarius]|uniref:Transmembrane protein 135 N-terminal domain-containing protein n=1 Tax=Larinioides sclopetarius TaxID=280406 RepID=A0AAV2A4E9_9ARAC